MVEATEKLALLNTLGREIATTLDLKKFVPKALENVARIMGSDLSLMYLRQRNQMVLMGVYPSEEPFDRVGTDVEEIGNCLCGLAGTGNAVYSANIHSDPNCIYNECKNAGITSVAALPLTVQGKVLGVLALASTKARNFSQESDFIEALIFQIALALYNVLLHDTMIKQVEELELSIEERKRMEDALRLSEANLENQLIELDQIYQTLPMGLCFLDTELRVVKINAELATINGKPVSAHIGKRIDEVLPEIAQQAEPMYRKVIETGKPALNYEIRGRSGNDSGENRDWLASYYPVKDEMGRLLGIGAILQDITERKQADRALKKSEERYQIVSGLTSDYAYAYRVAPDGQLIIDWVTGAFKRISGYTKEEIQARGGWETLIYPPDIPIPTKQFKALFKNEATAVEYRIITKTEEIRWMRDYARPVMDDTGTTLKYIYGAVQDITGRKDAEVALLASEEKYRDLVENINDAIFMADKNGQVVYISPAIEAIAGYVPSELIGKNVSKYVFQEDLPSVTKRYKELLKGIVTSSEFRIVTKTGQPRWVKVSNTPVFNGEKMTGVRGIMTDIDESKWAEKENKRLQEQLQQAQKMEAIGTLAGGIAHDFNNILAAIIGYTEMALIGAEKDSPLDKNLQEVFQASGRAKDLVKQILTFSRQNEQEHQPVQAKLIVKEVTKFMRASLPTTIKIKQNIQSGALVMADPTQLYQILLNLCSNAGQAMADSGGLLEIKLADINIVKDFAASFPDLMPGPYIQLSVSDTGHGISKSNLQRIFDPFFTTKEKEKGTGMGLSVVHGIVGSHGGQINVVSDPGVGSTFTVYLPTIEQLERPTPQPQKHIETGTEHILIVDDEKPLANIGKKILESLGYQVTTSTNSLEALELFKTRQGDFDLVITDMTMPNMAGDRLAQEILRINPQIPIILCSGYSSKIDQNQALALGIRAFVAKPILRNEIAGTVRTILDKRGKA